MLKKLTTWLIAVVFIFQTFFLVSPAQASPISPLNSTLLATLSNNSKVDNLEFSDTNKFYQDLAEALKSNKEVKISTNYKSYDDLPPKLKDIFKVKFDEAKISFPENTNIGNAGLSAAGAAGLLGSPTSGAAATSIITGSYSSIEMPATINYHAYALLFGGIAIGATTGAGIGTLFGGIGAAPGALGGGILALVSGVVIEAFNNPDHEGIITFGSEGLSITIRPTKQTSA